MKKVYRVQVDHHSPAAQWDVFYQFEKKRIELRIKGLQAQRSALQKEHETLQRIRQLAEKTPMFSWRAKKGKKK
jgi:hypothetical protein